MAKTEGDRTGASRVSYEVDRHDWRRPVTGRTSVDASRTRLAEEINALVIKAYREGEAKIAITVRRGKLVGKSDG